MNKRLSVSASFFTLLLSTHLYSDEPSLIRLNTGPINPETESAAGPRARAATSFSGKRLHLVQFDGPIQPEWVAALEAAGQKIVTYIPDNAYLVYGDASAQAEVRSLRARNKHVRWEGAYLEEDKIQPRAQVFDRKGNARIPETDLFAIQLVKDESANAATLAMVDAIKLAPIQRLTEVLDYVNVIVRLPPDQVAALAGQPDVVSINVYITPKKRDERQDIIVSGQLTGNGPSGPGYLAWLAARGFTQAQFDTSGLVVDVTDSGLDNATTTPNHFALYKSGDTSQASRVVYNKLQGTANSGSTLQGCDGHGNLNAHIIGGYVALTNFPHTDSAGYRYGLGVCPYVKVGSSVIFDPSNFTTPNYATLLSFAYTNGARISGNSWGADTAGGYDTDAQTYDSLVRDAVASIGGNQQMTVVFAAGNAGSSAQTVGSPGTAKNVITVGAAENVHSHASTNGGNNASGNDGCTTPDTEANSANDIASFSSRGPCSDQRRKPEIVAPGTHITGGVAQQLRSMQGNGTNIACFSGEGVCALPGGGTVGSTNNFFPLGQRFYSTSSGTSHSTPAVAGGCALIYQWFLNQGLNAPSPAMVKAVLMNAARYMNGTSAGDSLWSNNQGMGMMNLGFAFDGTQRIFRDQLTNELFTATGQSRTYTVQVVSNSKPFRVTLAWTDAPGATSGNAYMNNLNLSVVAGGVTYLGNVFSGSNSVSGGTADARNNAESVFLPAGTTGIVVVTVSAANINSDGVPNFGGLLDQDYALVIYNAVEVQAPSVVAAGSQLAAESCGAGNSAVDPDEQVTIRFALRNAGSAPTTNVVATLLATGGVTAPSGAQSYGALAAGGAAVTNSFTFTAAGVCGGTVTAQLALVDGATDLGTASFTFPLGGSLSATVTNNNASTITIVDNNKASPYPATINVSGMAGTIAKVTVSLFGFSHTYPEDVDVLLVGPGGQSVALMGAVGGGTDAIGVNLTFDDDAAANIGSSVVTGTFKPTGSIASMPTPAPVAPYGSELADFKGTTPNGTWSLYVVDAAATDAGSISGGWRLTITAAEPLCCASNQPPILAPIGNRTVVQSNNLTFAVSATDPYDGDPITLTVSNAPAGSTFSSTNGNGTFAWTNALPVGVYTSTFYASDKDGVDFETIQITVSDGSCVGSNIISEGFDGSTSVPAGWTNSGTANDTAATHYQSAPNCRSFGNGAWLITPPVSYPTQIVFYVDASSGGNGQTATIDYSVNGGAFASLGSFVARTAGSNVTFNLTASPNLSGSANVRFRFNSSFNTWYLDDVRIRGGCAPAPGSTPPALNPIGSKTVQVSNTLQFAVSATPTEGDAVTLTASNLPPGAAFYPTNENGTFVWTEAAPVGVYTTTFYAADDDGIVSEAVAISVIPVNLSSTNVALQYVFEDASLAFTRAATNVLPGLSAGLFFSGKSTWTNVGGNPNLAILDTGFISTTGNYFGFTLTVPAGSTLAVSRAKFDDQRSNTGPSSWALRSSLDGYASDLAAGVTHATFATNEASLSLAGVTGAVTFRIIGNSGTAGGTWRLDNVFLYGGYDVTDLGPLPSITITTAPQSVANAVTNFNVGGTANTNVTGQFRWTNSLNGAAGTIAAGTSWLITGIPLAVGANPISVLASNAIGDTASASVTITRQSAGGGGGCSNILFQGFEIGDNWTIVNGSERISENNGGTNFPPNQRMRSGTNSWQAANLNTNVTLASVSIAGYTQRQVSVRVASIGVTSGQGSEASDVVRVFVALNDATFSATPDVVVAGNTPSFNARWGFWATNSLTTTAGTTVSNQSPQGGLSSNNYANLFINIPDSATSIALRVSAINDNINEIWCVDDIALYGCAVGVPPALPLLVITTAPQTVAFSVSDIAVGGTSSNLAGQIQWTNTLSGDFGAIAASDPWLVSGLPLAVGTNFIVVRGQTAENVETNDGVSIIRSPWDSDGDSVADEWELFYFGNLTTVTPTSDSDGDGMLDVDEFYAGSIPTNSASLLKATGVAVPGATIIQWQSHSNRNYRISSAPDLLAGFTVLATNVPATPPLNSWTGATSTNALDVFRIELQ